MEPEESEDEKSLYRVSIPIYSSRVKGKPKDNEQVDSIEEFNAIRYNASDIQLNSALFFTDEAKRIETHIVEETKDDDEAPRIDARLPIGNRHDIFVMNSVVSTISFLEALINEFYDRHQTIANERNSTEFSEKLEKEENVSDPRFYKLLENQDYLEPRNFEYKSVLEKYQILLSFADKQIFDKGSEPYQTISTIQAFRNKVVHAEAEWIKVDSDESLDIEDRLEGKFKLNPIKTPEVPLRQYLSFECAKWSIESALDFVIEFYNRMGTNPPPYVINSKNNPWDIDSILEAKKVEEKDACNQKEK